MIFLLTFKTNFSESYKITVSDWSSEEFWRGDSNLYTPSRSRSLTWIKPGTQEVMNSYFNSSTTIVHEIYYIVEIMSNLSFIKVTKVWP